MEEEIIRVMDILSYLKDKDLQGYRDLVKKLNLRG